MCCGVLQCMAYAKAAQPIFRTQLSLIQALQRPAYHRNNQSECVVVFAMYCDFCSVRTHLSPRLMVYNALCAIHRCSRKQCVAACHSVLRPLEKAVHSLR